MRKPRVIVCSFTGRVLSDLMALFRRKGYEIFVLTKSAPCPFHVHDRHNQVTCSVPVPCSDITVVVQDIEQPMSFDTFTRQFPHGCKLTLSNTAIITRTAHHAPFDNHTVRDMTIFGYPFEAGAFEVWLQGCENRMNLSQRLAVIRRARRYSYGRRELCLLHGIHEAITAEEVNISNMGICLKTQMLIRSGRVIRITGPAYFDAEEGVVRWMKKIDEGWYISGVTFCI